MHLSNNDDNRHKKPKVHSKKVEKKILNVDKPIKSDINEKGWQKEQKAWKLKHKNEMN